MIVRSPLEGRTCQLTDVPDRVIADGMLGAGLAIDPVRSAQVAVAPVAGTLIKLHPHAYLIQADDGRGVLVHLGIDTVHMHGEGFTHHAREDDRLAAGDPVTSWDPAYVAASGRSPISVVVALDTRPDEVVSVTEQVHVVILDDLFELLAPG